MSLEFTTELAALAQVVAIDLVLAGDNAIVIGMAAAGLPRLQRSRAILIGIGAATVLRIGFALIAAQVLHLTGLLLAGGLLLLWVAWKMWRELTASAGDEIAAADSLTHADIDGLGTPATPVRKTLFQAVTQIVVADVSMSLDNVLAVAGAAREHTMVLAAGLVLSIGLMGMAASLMARILARHRWISYLGLAIILFVAVRLCWDGARELLEAAGSA